jgi:hypothetical protein
MQILFDLFSIPSGIVLQKILQRKTAINNKKIFEYFSILYYLFKIFEK